MGRISIALLILVSLLSPMHADEPVPDAAKMAVEAYRSDVENLKREHSDLIVAAKKRHAEQLDQLIEQAQSAGHLDDVLKLREEKGKIARSTRPVGTVSPSKAASARRVYDETVRKTQLAFNRSAEMRFERFLTDLAAVEMDETKAGRIDAALKVRDYAKVSKKVGPAEFTFPENVLSDAAAGEWVDLLEWSEEIDWAPRGIDWNSNVEGKPTKALITLKRLPFNRFPLAAIIDGDYEMEVEFTRHAGNDAVNVFFPVGIHTVAVEISGYQGTVSSVRYVDGKRFGEQRPGTFSNGKPHRLLIRVSREGDNASFNIDWDDHRDYIKWQGPYSALTYLEHLWGITTIQRPWIGSFENDLTFSKVRVRMLSGTIRRDVISEADLEQDRKNGFVRLVGEKAINPQVDWGQFVINQIPIGPAAESGFTERCWPHITREFRICDDFYGAHAPSRLKCPIPNGAKSFSVVGYNDCSRSEKYLVYIDGNQVYDSGVTDIAIAKVDIPPKSSLLELVIDSAGDNRADHTYWCYPRYHSVPSDKISNQMLDGKPGPLRFTIASHTVGAQTLTHNEPIFTLKSAPVHFRDAQPCDEFLFAHAPSTVTYVVPEGMTRFTAIGYNVHSHHVEYEVWADTKRIYESPQAGIIPIDVKLPPGTKTIELKINNLGVSHYDRSMWCYPRLHRR